MGVRAQIREQEAQLARLVVPQSDVTTPLHLDDTAAYASIYSWGPIQGNFVEKKFGSTLNNNLALLDSALRPSQLMAGFLKLPQY